jgi:Flp pilus assembly protein TadG
MPMLRSILHRRDGTAAVETAIFLPIFMILTFGITDIGSGIFVRQRVNAAVQAGATYAVINSGIDGQCETMGAACESGVKAAMTAASGIASFCTGDVCTPSITGCADGSPKCLNVSAEYSLTPILPSTLYAWAMSMVISSSLTIRIPV